MPSRCCAEKLKVRDQPRILKVVGLEPAMAPRLERLVKRPSSVHLNAQS